MTTPMSPVLMGLDYVKENQANMWEKWAPQRRVETGVQSTGHFDTGADDHFNQPGHELADFNFLPFEKIQSSDPFLSLKPERVFG